MTDCGRIGQSAGVGEHEFLVPAEACASPCDEVGVDDLLTREVHLVDVQLDAHLFRTPVGDLYQRNNAGEAWRGIRKAAGLPETVTLHTLRHTFASNLIASGCDVVTVQRALGHAQPSITLNTYAHLWPSAEDKTRAATADLMTSIAALADSPRTGNEKGQIRGLI